MKCFSAAPARPNVGPCVSLGKACFQEVRPTFRRSQYRSCRWLHFSWVHQMCEGLSLEIAGCSVSREPALFAGFSWKLLLLGHYFGRRRRRCEEGCGSCTRTASTLGRPQSLLVSCHRSSHDGALPERLAIPLVSMPAGCTQHVPTSAGLPAMMTCCTTEMLDRGLSDFGVEADGSHLRGGGRQAS